MNGAWILGSLHSIQCQLSGSGFKDFGATVAHYIHRLKSRWSAIVLDY